MIHELLSLLDSFLTRMLPIKILQVGELFLFWLKSDAEGEGTSSRQLEEFHNHLHRRYLRKSNENRSKRLQNILTPQIETLSKNSTAYSQLSVTLSFTKQ